MSQRGVGNKELVEWKDGIRRDEKRGLRENTGMGGMKELVGWISRRDLVDKEEISDMAE